MDKQAVAKITISLPPELLALADRIAQERSLSRSGVIAALLAKEEETRIQTLMAEGYQAMAEESRSFAEEAFPLVSEAIHRSTEWNEGDGG